MNIRCEIVSTLYGGMWWFNGSAPDCKNLQSRVRIRHLSNLQGHAIPCWGASRVGMITAGWPLRGGRGKISINWVFSLYGPVGCGFEAAVSITRGI